MGEWQENETTMRTCAAALHSVVGDREDIIGFAIVLLKDDADGLVISRASTQDLADRLDGAHGAILNAVNDAMEPKNG